MAVTVPKIGVQLFTLKEEFAGDPFGTLQRVAAIGFEGVEFVGSSLRSLDPNKLRQKLLGYKLKIAGATFETEELEHDLEAIVRLCHSIDCPSVVLPSIRAVDCGSKDAFKDAALKMNYIASRCKREGIAFLYHTHGLEFQIVDGRSGIDWLSTYWDPRLIRLEPDTYWVENEGVDAVSFIKHFGSWCSSIHFKDMKDRTGKRDAEVGTGVIDVTGVVREALSHNMRWFIIEQEQFNLTPLDSIKISYKNLSEIMIEERNLISKTIHATKKTFAA